MSFLWPVGLAFAALLPAIVILYFLKLHRSPKVVSSTYLWKAALDAYRVNRPFQRFQNHLLLWLQLLILAIIIFALARPMMETEQQQTGVHIYLLDHSASMSTREGDGTRLDRAKRFLREAINGKKSGERMAIVGFSDRAFVASPLRTDKESLLAALGQVGPTNRPTKIEDAWWTALSIARNFQASDVYIVSDGGFGTLDQLTQANATVHYVPMGKTVDNTGIVHLESRESGDDRKEMEIFARVMNRRKRAVTTRVELYINDRLADAQNVVLPAEEQKGIVFHRRTRESGVAEVRIPTEDAFARDNRAWVVLSPQEPLRVLLVSKENVFLREGLRNNPQVALAVLQPNDFDQLKGNLPAADLVVFDGVYPKELPGGTYLFMGSLPPLPGFENGGVAEGPTLVNWDREHPLTRYINFSTLHIAKMVKGKNPGWMKELLTGSEGAVLAAGESRGIRIAVARFSLLESDWPLRVSFPIFLSNVMNWARDVEGTAAGVVRPGEPLVVPVPAESVRGTLLRPDGREEELEAGEERRSVVSDTELPGVYRISWENRKREAMYTVNLLDPKETDIFVPGAVKMGDQNLKGAEESTLVNREFTHILVLIALVILIGEWILYQALKR